MAGLTEQSKWENEIYCIEENDPVHGGENGITNKPTKQLANRTQYLKKMLEAAGQKLNPKKLTATTRNAADTSGHTHEIDLASTTTKGLVQLTNDTGLDSESLALTAKAGKKLAQEIARVHQLASNKYTDRPASTVGRGTVMLANTLSDSSTDKALTAARGKDLAQRINQLTQTVENNYIPNSQKSSAVNSNSADTVATSAAVKTAYDLANAAYKVDKTNQDQNLDNLLGQNTVWGIAGKAHTATGLPAEAYNYGVGLAMNAAGANAVLYVPHSHRSKFNGVWLMASYHNNGAPPHWFRIDGVDKLDKSGGTLTGALEINTADSFVRGKRNGTNNWFVGTANGTSNDIVLRSYAHNTHISLQADKVYTNKDIYVGENKVNHWGDSYLKATANNYGGIMIDRPTRNDRMLIESHDNRFALIRRNTQSGENHYVITTPERSGTVALEGEAIRTVHKGHGSYASQYTSGAPIMVDETGSRDRDTYHPIVKVKVRSAGSFGAAFSFGYVTRARAQDGWGQGAIHLIEDNGRNSKAWLFEHSGDFYAPGDIRTGTGKRLNAVEPAGLVAYFARTSAPEGWLKANGAAVSRTTYAALFAAIGTTFGEGDGSTTFNLPDLRGEFIRGFRDGRNVDNGRAFGSFQGDAIRNITGNFSVRPAGDDSQSPVLIGGNSVFRQQPSTEAWLPVNLKRAGEQNLSLMTFDASRAVPTANENRPRNIALLACIKY